MKEETKTKPLHLVVLILCGVAFALYFAATVDVHRFPARFQPALGGPILELKALGILLRQHYQRLIPIALGLLVIVLSVVRVGLEVWHNHIIAKLTDTQFHSQEYGFRKVDVSLSKWLKETPRGRYFVGLRGQGRWIDRILGRNRAVFLDEAMLDSHGHIMGHTGTGKTLGVLMPLMLQDMRNRKGVLFMDPKGSMENAQLMALMAKSTGRIEQLRVFSLAAKEKSHSYNPVYMKPGHEDPEAVAERVFSVFDMENPYYRDQSWELFRNLIWLFSGTGRPFNLQDIRVALRDDKARQQLYPNNQHQQMIGEIESQLALLGNKRNETFTGLYTALGRYNHPLLNAYRPDIVLEDVMNQQGIVYFNLPANRYPVLAPAIGKIVLQHVQGIASMRQLERDRFDQTPFSVNVDELNRFAFENLVPALAMCRDAHVQFRLAHQSIGDLEQVSETFAKQVCDNTRWKVFLFENDPDHLEKVARSLGTKTAFKRTVRYSLGPLWSHINTGEVSNREVDEFVMHPNALKALAERGQAYLLLPRSAVGINLPNILNVR